MSSKLDILMNEEGYDDYYVFLEDIVADSISPGICMNPGCNYTCEVEPDCIDGWCENCSDYSVSSALIIAGII